ncbi:MAG: purine-binding chemotaxis protein CheW [Planctomycetota bacterium]|nr:MAG: purine-binding chemotaxis protein CheW [Planctomycetota bacterium]
MTNRHAEKYLSFEVGEEHYGIAILGVQEIIGMMRVTRVPKLGDAWRGVINLRGKVIPIVDLRRAFDLPHGDDSERTCIVVVQVACEEEAITMGLVVDAVREVVDIPEDAIEPPPRFASSIATDFLTGMAKLGDRVVALLDIDRLVAGSQLQAAATVVSEVADP